MTKRLTSYFIFLLLLFSASPVFAQSVAQSSLHSTGTVTVEVVDEDNQEVEASWTLRENDRNGIVVYNGVGTETVKLYSGAYYLVMEDMKGYETFEVTTDNPQEVAPRGFITFRVIYYVAIPTEEEVTPETQVEPEPETAEPEVTPPVKKPRIFVPPVQTTPKPAKPFIRIPVTPSPQITETEEELTEEEVTLEEGRTPLRGNPPETPYSLMGQGTKAALPSGGSRTISLAVTGPSSGLIPLLLSLSAGTSFFFIRRRLKKS